MQIISVGGDINGDLSQEPLIAYLPEAQTEQCTGEALLPVEVGAPVGEWFDGKIMVCGGYLDNPNGLATDMCHVFDR